MLKLWKSDIHGALRKTITRKHSIAPMEELQGKRTLYFERTGDSGSAGITYQGGFVGLLFAGNDFTSTSYLTLFETFFIDIKKMTRAEAVELASEGT